MAENLPARRSPGRPARRDEDGGGVREALLDAARSLFARRDYPAVSIREIAAEAGVTPAMVHYYFGDKQGLFDAMLEATFGRVLEHARRAAAERRSDGLAGLLEILVETIGNQPWLPPLVLREVFSEDGRMRDRFIEMYAGQMGRLMPALIQAEIDAGRMREDLDPRLAFMSLAGMALMPFVARPVIERVLEIDYDEDFRHRYAEHAWRLFLEGTRA